MKTRMILLTMVLVLTAGGTAGAGPGIDAVRAEVVAVRAAVGQETVLSPDAAKLLFDAGEMFTEAIGIIDEDDPARMKKMFGRLGKALRLMKKATKKEKSAGFDEFVRDRGERLWIVTSTLFKGGTPVIGDPGNTDLERKLTKKMRKPARLMADGKYASAIKRLKGAWLVLVKIDDDP